MRGYLEKGVTNPFLWDYNFPPVYGHTSVAFLKHCPGFEKAKYGDIRAALDVVNMCIKPNRIDELRRKHPDAVLLPIITNNRLPEAFAGQFGMSVHEGVYELRGQFRKSLTAMERLLYAPYFSGKIIRDTKYIIVDDIVTQGGTVSALRKYVIINNGRVIAATALAFSVDSRIIVPGNQDVRDLIEKFTYDSLVTVLRNYNIAYDICELTRSQIKYLLRFDNIESMINCIKNQRGAKSAFAIPGLKSKNLIISEFVCSASHT